MHPDEKTIGIATIPETLRVAIHDWYAENAHLLPAGTLQESRIVGIEQDDVPKSRI